MENECCICLNDIEDGNIFILECCKYTVHHDCIVQWINANIDRDLPDYNKCILCKSYNQTIDYYYNNLINNYNNNTYINLDNSSNDFIILVNPITENNNNQIILVNYFKQIICILIICLLIIFIIQVKLDKQ